MEAGLTIPGVIKQVEHLYSKDYGRAKLELELIQTHIAQKPMLRVEVGALGAHQVKNMRGRAG